MDSIRHALFDVGFSAITMTQADRWLRPAAQGKGIILAFHRVRPWKDALFAPNRFLEITPTFLERTIDALAGAGFDFLPIDAVPERLVETSRRRPFAVFTFDDGYRDNLRYAWPILKRKGVPWTIYVVPDFLDAKGVLWWLDLEAYVGEGERIEIEVGKTLFRLPTRSPREKQAAFSAVARHLRQATRRELSTFSATVAAAMRRDPGLVSREVCADWDEIAELGSDGLVTIGAHTSSHPILSRLDQAEVEEELQGSRQSIEKRLSRPVRHFAYPHGDKSAAGAREYRLAGQAGFTTAVTTRPDHLRGEHAAAMHALPRVSINGLHQTDRALTAIISGVPFLLRRMKR